MAAERLGCLYTAGSVFEIELNNWPMFLKDLSSFKDKKTKTNISLKQHATTICRELQLHYKNDNSFSYQTRSGILVEHKTSFEANVSKNA